MNFIKKLIIFTIFFVFMGIQNIFAAINMSITPIKYELEANPGETVTKEAKITNNSDKTFHIITGKSDFVASGETGKPQFIRRSEEVLPQELSNWITIDTNEFDLAPGETKKIHFSINVPENATPGGHYGAIFFKNKNSENSNGGQVGINVDYGVLILLKVQGEVITNVEIQDPIIVGGGSGKVKHMDVCNETGGDFSGDYYDGKCGENPNKTNSGNTDKINNKQEKKEEKKQKDNCIIDLTNSEYDGKCIDDNKKIIDEITGNIDEVDFEKEFKDEENFNIKIKIPVKNKGNIHVKPKGKIILKDENGNVIKGVGKEIITNKKGAIIGEKIVDYIPINDIGGNVLPGTKRVFESDFKGFPYKTYDEEGNLQIKYWTPGEYYTKQSLGKKTFLMPWERISTKDKTKKITAKFDISYPDSDGEEIEFNSAKEFEIKYKQKEKELNPYFFILLGIGLLFIFLLYLIFKTKKKKCINCKKKIDKDMQVCPYCGAKQNKTKKSKKDKRIIIAKKEKKLKVKDLELQEKIKNILIKNKIKFVSELEKMKKNEILKIKGIGEVAYKEIKKSLKK